MLTGIRRYRRAGLFSAIAAQHALEFPQFARCIRRHWKSSFAQAL
jgi:hypothetical protein